MTYREHDEQALTLEAMASGEDFKLKFQGDKRVVPFSIAVSTQSVLWRAGDNNEAHDWRWRGRARARAGARAESRLSPKPTRTNPVNDEREADRWELVAGSWQLAGARWPVGGGRW